jgi:hypothetical protein
MNRFLPIAIAVITVALIAAATVRSSSVVPATTPEGAVQSLFAHAKNRNWDGALAYVANRSGIDPQLFRKDLGGSDGSLKTYSSLQNVITKVLQRSEDEALVRTDLQYSTAVGAFYDTRDLKVVRDGRDWKVLWHEEKPQKVPPQVIPVNYLRWDIIQRDGNDDWGSQNVEPPRVRIVSMNATEREGNTIILGEVVNEDTVPGYVSVNAQLTGKDGSVLGEETSFDKISHTLLPKEVSPFRIDFPGVPLRNVKSVKMDANAVLVPASADPVIGVARQRLEKDARGRSVLRGELVNHSGITVNIPHVLATFYDNAGKVIWVSDGYVDKALLPQTPVQFAVELRDDLASKVQNYRVTVNHYSVARQ